MSPPSSFRGVRSTNPESMVNANSERVERWIPGSRMKNARPGMTIIDGGAGFSFARMGQAPKAPPQTTGVMAHVWSTTPTAVIPGRAKHEPGIHLTAYSEFLDAWIPGSLARRQVYAGCATTRLAPRNDKKKNRRRRGVFCANGASAKRAAQLRENTEVRSASVCGTTCRPFGDDIDGCSCWT